MAAAGHPYRGRSSRRSHKKSRLGCKNCKRRKIKCDEVKPACSNCVRHAIDCDYTSNPPTTIVASSSDKAVPAGSAVDDDFTFISSSQANFTPPKRAHRKRVAATTELSEPPSPPGASSSSAIAHKPFQFTATDLALFHHFMSCPELGADQPQWQTQMTRWGFQHHYLLRLLLALSGFHLARNPDEQLKIRHMTGQGIEYAAEAEKHYEIAVREAASIVPQITGCNGQTVYTGAVLIFTCSMGRGPQPGEYLGFREDGAAGCLSLFTGVRSILDICSNVLSLDVSSSHAWDAPEISPQQPHEGSAPIPAGTGAIEVDPLEQLRILLNKKYPSELSVHLDYSRVLDGLKQTYGIVHPPPDSPLERLALFPHVFGWLYRSPDSFLSDLQQRKPLALVIFAFFAVLLKALNVAWFIRGWPEHILDGCWRHLDGYHRQFLSLPMQEVL
ncbi:hypothetical protein BDV10DRAFT_172192 [Aspergillus recurvatus]